MLENAGFDVIVEDRTDQVCLTLWSSLLSICISSLSQFLISLLLLVGFSL
jgi:hypothetical protein